MEVVTVLGKAQCQLTELRGDCGTPCLPQGFAAHSQHSPLSLGAWGSWLPLYHTSKSAHSGVPHSELKVQLRSSLPQQCSGQRMYNKIISKSYFCWKAENLETHNSGKSSIKVKGCPLSTNKSVFSALPKDAKHRKYARLPQSIHCIC